jgi:hypothetical protein
MFLAGTAVNVIVAPWILWRLLEQLVPAGRPRIGAGWRHQRLQTLLGRWVKAIHAFIKLQLRPDRLNVGSNGCLFGESRRIANLRDRQSQQNDDDANHDHDLEERESLLLASHSIPNETPNSHWRNNFPAETFLLAGFEKIIRLVPEIF